MGRHTQREPSITQFERDRAALGKAFALVATDIRSLGADLVAMEQVLSRAVRNLVERERIDSGRGNLPQVPRVPDRPVPEADSRSCQVLVSAAQMKRMLGISNTTLWNWVKQGVLPAPVKIGPRTSRWKMADVDRFIESLGAKR